jgi:transposase
MPKFTNSERRQKKILIKELFRKGLSLKAIRDELDISETTMNRWFSEDEEVSSLFFEKESIKSNYKKNLLFGFEDLFDEVDIK